MKDMIPKEGLKTIILIIVIALLTIISVIAYSTVEKTAPFTEYQIFTTTSINISGGVNASGASGLTNAYDIVNVTILNKSSSAGAYGILNVSGQRHHLVNASNGTTNVFWNFTATLTEERHWIRINFTNASSVWNETMLTNETVFDIDVDYDVITIGQDVINLSTVTGNINISGIIRADSGASFGGNVLITSTPLNMTDTGNINTSGIISTPVLRLQNNTLIEQDCGATTYSRWGEIRFNSTGPGYFFGCTPVGWINFTWQSS